MRIRIAGVHVDGTLVGRSLRLLPKPSVVVSYADTAQGHVGYVYQAANFIYTGLSAKRTDWKKTGAASSRFWRRARFIRT